MFHNMLCCLDFGFQINISLVPATIGVYALLISQAGDQKMAVNNLLIIMSLICIDYAEPLVFIHDLKFPYFLLRSGGGL